jgi:hypothetical protein
MLQVLATQLVDPIIPSWVKRDLRPLSSRKAVIRVPTTTMTAITSFLPFHYGTIWRLITPSFTS